jgi:hypothetical protein
MSDEMIEYLLFFRFLNQKLLIVKITLNINFGLKFIIANENSELIG